MISQPLQLTTRVRRKMRFTPTLSVTHDGRWLIAWEDREVRIFDAATPAPAVLSFKRSISALAAAGPWIVIASSDKLLHVLRAADLSIAYTHATPAAVRLLALDPAGTLLALDGDGTLHRLTLGAAGATDAASLPGESYEHGYMALTLSADGSTAAMTSCPRDARSCPVLLIDVATLTVKQALKGPRAAVASLAFSPSGATLIAATATSATAWALPKGKARSFFKAKSYLHIVGFADEQLVILDDHKNETLCIDLTTDQPVWSHPSYGPAHLSCGRLVHSRFNALCWRDPRSGAPLGAAKAPNYPWALTVDPIRDAAHVATSSGNLLTTWRLDQPAVEPSAQRSGAPISAASSSPDGRWLALGTDEGVIMLWDLHDDAPKPRIIGPISYYSSNYACDAVFVDADHDLLWASMGSRVGLWRMSTGEELRYSAELKDEVTALLPMRADGVVVAAARARRRSYGALIILDLHTLAELHDERLSHTVTSLSPLPTGEVEVGFAAHWQALDLKTRKLAPAALVFPMMYLATSPDRSRACSRHYKRRADSQELDHWLQRWEVKPDPQPLGEPISCDEVCAHLRYTSDGAHFISLHPDALRRWDAATGALLATTAHQIADPCALHLTPDGRCAVVSGDDGACDLIPLA